MKKSFVFGMTLLLIQLVALTGSAQQDKLEGRWEGKMVSPQGERPANATFKKEGGSYTGTITGLRGDTTLKEIKVEGDKITAKAEIETPQATVTVNYTFTLQGEGLKGTGSLDFGGNAFTFEMDFKRAAGTAAASQPASQPAAPAADAAAQNQARQQRVNVPQPQQKQSIDYFVGQWSYKYLGRESALNPAPREGVMTFTKRPDGKSLEGVGQGKHEGGAFKESFVINFDEASKLMSCTEKLGSGVTLNSKADWTSPISIRFTIDPVKVKGQTLQLRRTIAIVAAHSFTVTEELSEDGGPFIRLGNAVYSKN